MYQFKYKIKEEDINYGKHVGNERALLFFQSARINFFSSLGLEELNIGDGIGVIQKNAYVEYNKQLFFNDSIFINITDIELSRSSFNMIYEVYDNVGDLVIKGSTLLVCYDYKKKKIKKIPESFKNTLNTIKNGDVQ